MIVEVKVPTPGESVTEVQIASWLKNDGDIVEMDEGLCELESDKATLVLNAEAEGKLEIVIQEGESVEVNAVVARIDTSATGSGASAPKEAAPAAASPAPEPTHAPPATASTSDHYASGSPSPAAKKIMDEKGISASSIQGSGKDGRITKADATSASPAVAPPAASQSSPAVTSTASTSGERNENRKRMSPMRKKIAERLVSVKNETAMLTTFNEVDMTQIMSIRKKYKDQFEKTHNIRLGFMSFFTKAVCESLKAFPEVNAYIDGQEIVYHDYMDVGIAVSAPKGLMVPVVRNAQAMSLAQLEEAIQDLALKARDNKITIDEMTGGTFTITNGGVFGSLMATPIINPPQSAILGMHKIEERPIAMNGEVVIRPMMYIALSYDHRIIDGRESVGFLVKVKEYLEDPVRLLLHI